MESNFYLKLLWTRGKHEMALQLTGNRFEITQGDVASVKSILTKLTCLIQMAMNLIVSTGFVQIVLHRERPHLMRREYAPDVQQHHPVRGPIQGLLAQEMFAYLLRPRLKLCCATFILNRQST